MTPNQVDQAKEAKATSLELEHYQQ